MSMMKPFIKFHRKPNATYLAATSKGVYDNTREESIPLPDKGIEIRYRQINMDPESPESWTRKKK